MPPNPQQLLSSHRPKLDSYEQLYKHLHSHPELSQQESQTAELIASHLRTLSSDLDIRTSIGGHGLIGILRNGSGPTVLLRADFDALPIREKTGLPYASTVEMVDEADGLKKPVMHACGHDFHVSAMLAAVETLVACRQEWEGTLVALFQPAEERAFGAKAMVDGGLYKSEAEGGKGCPIPDVVLGQHVFPLQAGIVGTRSGPIMSAADSFKVTIYGRGGHGSMPHRCIDPLVIASHVVVRLQTVVSREVAPDQTAVVTVGALQAGQTENVIADEALLRINIRTFDEAVRDRVLKSVSRIIRAECQAGNSPKEPLIEPTTRFPLTDNDVTVNEKLSKAFDAHFGDKHMANLPNVLGSEDFGILGSAVGKPYVFWFFGGHDEAFYKKMKGEGREDEIPVNHSPFFAPVIQPTLATGVDALVVAALTFLGKGMRG